MSPQAARTRVLIVDDSAVMRLVLRRMVEKAGFEVVGTAAEGVEAVEQALRTRPDVITLDVEMPGMDGLQALDELTKRTSAGILMVSNLTRTGAEVTLEALERGAFDYIPKTNGLDERFEAELIRKIRLASSFARSRRKAPEREAKQEHPAPVYPTLPPVRFHQDPTREAVLIGSSTGGPRALSWIIPSLPQGFPLGIVIAQHMPPMFTGALAERLDRESQLRVKEAEDGEPILPGCVYVAPGGKQTTVVRQEPGSVPILRLRDSDPVREIFAPSVDVMMLSAVEAYPGPCLGVVLTGMGSDGRRGMGAIKEAGGITLVQDRSSCVVAGMVRACLEAKVADAEVPLAQLPGLMSEIVGGTRWASGS
ncbi:MAG: chemotaxis response regulator protein-glutamate methylesterase [candidate division KSB1 bacterium]|nr:chemotaxis response regulator protein-glutamate methylesterase [candidate division KSB1 bacterium]